MKKNFVAKFSITFLISIAFIILIMNNSVLATDSEQFDGEHDNNAVWANWQVFPGYNEGASQGTPCGWSQVYYDSQWMS